MGHSLGNLPYKTKVRVTGPTGKSIVLVKRDIGKGGGPLGGHKRGIDLWYKAARKIGADGGGAVKVEVLGRGNVSKGKIAPAKATPASDTSGGLDRRTALLSYLQEKNKPGALLNLAQNLQDVKQNAAPVSGTPTPKSAGSSLIQAATKRADIINARHQPYKWGGGHVGSATQGRQYTGPLDCSGAVSKVLGINPRVASEFQKIGKPGASRSHITIYAKPTHVLMYVPGKGFFGTSRSNPGGGAGWVKPSELPAGYLKGFTARHL